MDLRLLLIGLLLCGACSDDNSSTGGRSGSGNDQGLGGDGDGGDTGQDFGNSDGTDDLPGSGGAPGEDRPQTAAEFCSPGVYRGTYKCDLTANGAAAGVLEGAVQFDLAIDETAVADECPPDQEFCFDLVIPEGSGTLFGFVGFLVGFETELEGGLDCREDKLKFQATAVNGVWGLPVSSDPNDPNAPATVADPPNGTFDGTLDGDHNNAQPEKIEGEWDLTEPTYGYNCKGPFTVELLP